LTPCKIETLEQTHSLSGLIMSARGTLVPNLVKIRSRGTSFYFFLSDQRREETPYGFWRAMAQKTRNRPRMCLFGVIKWKI